MGIEREDKTAAKWHNMGFLPLIFPNSGYLECNTLLPPKMVGVFGDFSGK